MRGRRHHFIHLLLTKYADAVVVAFKPLRACRVFTRSGGAREARAYMSGTQRGAEKTLGLGGQGCARVCSGSFLVGFAVGAFQ